MSQQRGWTHSPPGAGGVALRFSFHRSARRVDTPRALGGGALLRPSLVLSLPLLLWSALAVSQETPPAPEVLAIVGARVFTMVGDPLEAATILVSQGKIKAVGADAAVPDGATRIDAAGKTVIPGLVDAWSCLYLYPSDRAEGTAVGSEFSVCDGLDTYDRDAPETLRHGVTTVHVVPGSRGSLAGRSAVLSVAADPGPLVVVSDRAAVRGQIGVPAGGTSSSLERLEGFTTIREALLATQDYLWEQGVYARKLAQYERKKAGKDKAPGEEGKADEGPPPDKEDQGEKPQRPKKPATDPGREALARVLKGEVSLLVEAHRAPDILNALRLRDEFTVRLVLLGATEGYRVAAEIARRQVPVIVAPLSPSVSGPSRLKYGEPSPGNAASLARAGVRVALGVGGSEGLHSKLVRTSAAVAVGHGLPRAEALRAITVTPAELLGVADRIGSLAEGKDADLVLIGGDPLDLAAPVETVIAGGRVVYQRGAEK